MGLLGVSPTTLYFSDRPERVVGHVVTEEMLVIWGEGDDSFADDPPNATLSIFGPEEVTDVVVELSNPRISGDTMTYDVIVLDGDPPSEGQECSLFIDTIGRPLTPISIAGVHRRHRRRHRRRVRSRH